MVKFYAQAFQRIRMRSKPECWGFWIAFHMGYIYTGAARTYFTLNDAMKERVRPVLTADFMPSEESNARPSII